MVSEELALEALFRAAGLEITEEDIEEEYAKYAEAGQVDVAELKERWEGTPAVDVFTEGLMHRKAIEWLVNPENVEIIDMDPSADAGTDDAPAEPAGEQDGSDDE